jgi:hypothetical protein
VSVTVDSPCAGVLVLTDAYFPGWTATVNGRSQTVHPADVALRGVFVGSGHSEVVFTYEPASFRHGVILATVSLLVLPSAAGLRYLSRRRRPIATVGGGSGRGDEGSGRDDAPKVTEPLETTPKWHVDEETEA